VRKYGCKKDTKDERDYRFKLLPKLKLGRLPLAVDLCDVAPALPIYNQGQLSSCTANAIARCLQFDAVKQGLADAVDIPSRLFLYFAERDAEGTLPEDGGAMIRTGAKVSAQLGVCLEKDWSYNESLVNVKPDPACYEKALRHQTLQYYRLDNTRQEMQRCLIEGFPFAVGITLFESFESQEVAKTGIVPMPEKGEAEVGGHAVQVVGYKMLTGDRLLYKLANSWGPDWGENGFFWLQASYLESNLANDLWTFRKVEG